MPFNDEMLYAGFRAAFVMTLDCMLRESLNSQNPAPRVGGFLDIYPSLQGTASQIQLECLLQTWSRIDCQESELALLDRCVVYAAYEALAKMGELAARPRLSGVWRGPKLLATLSDHWVTSKARTLQLMADERDASEISKLEAKMDDRRTVSPEFSRPEAPSLELDLTEIVGRWSASRDVIFGSTGLLTNEEQDILRIFFEEQAGMLR